MIMFKPYSNIKDFLYRFTLLKIGKLHIRLHKIVSPDQSTLYHNHPFHYVSIILKGGYSETIIDNGKTRDVKCGFLSIICRNQKVYHRINKIFGETITLFIAYGDYGWEAINTVESNDDGLYKRFVNGGEVWAKKANGIWFIGKKDAAEAAKETRHSIHQIL